MFPNVRLVILALLGCLVALSCGFGVFAAFRVNRDPLTRPPSGGASLAFLVAATRMPPAPRLRADDALGLRRALGSVETAAAPREGATQGAGLGDIENEAVTATVQETTAGSGSGAMSDSDNARVELPPSATAVVEAVAASPDATANAPPIAETPAAEPANTEPVNPEAAVPTVEPTISPPADGSGSATPTDQASSVTTGSAVLTPPAGAVAPDRDADALATTARSGDAPPPPPLSGDATSSPVSDDSPPPPLSVDATSSPPTVEMSSPPAAVEQLDRAVPRSTPQAPDASHGSDAVHSPAAIAAVDATVEKASSSPVRRTAQPRKLRAAVDKARIVRRRPTAARRPVGRIVVVRRYAAVARSRRAFRLSAAPPQFAPSSVPTYVYPQPNFQTAAPPQPSFQSGAEPQQPLAAHVAVRRPLLVRLTARAPLRRAMRRVN